ncbi:MAG TPA: GAF domain-containing SpoIIE family protein phosphatase [Bryobacteraceae bacterium]|nr:GAF domain-containing SpoIIE family protein phosphatase [Bryobacteraceae bacterium]
MQRELISSKSSTWNAIAADPEFLCQAVEKSLRGSVQCISQSLRIGQIALFVHTGTTYELAAGSGVPRGHQYALEAGAALQQLFHSHTEPVPIGWFDGTAHILGEPLDQETSGVLASLGAEDLVGIASENQAAGFLCLGEKAGGEPLTPGDVRLLQAMSYQAALVIENCRLSTALAAEFAERQRLNWEVSVVREVQSRIFPTARPTIPGLDYYSDWRPALGASGDYLDYFEMTEGNLGLAIGNVSGKGLPAALLASSLHSMVRALRLSQPCDLSELVTQIDESFTEMCPDNCYATLFVARYDPLQRRLHYVNAGHELPFILRKRGRSYRTIRLESGGPVIGMLRKPGYREGSVALNPGDLLVAYTDGLCEVTNPLGEEWGWRRLLEAIESCGGRTARDLVDYVIASAEKFAEGAPQGDDMTLWLGRVADAGAHLDPTFAEHKEMIATAA